MLLPIAGGITKSVELSQVDFVKAGSQFEDSDSRIVDMFIFEDETTRKTPALAVFPFEQKNLQFVFMESKDHAIHREMGQIILITFLEELIKGEAGGLFHKRNILAYSAGRTGCRGSDRQLEGR